MGRTAKRVAVATGVVLVAAGVAVLGPWGFGGADPGVPTGLATGSAGGPREAVEGADAVPARQVTVGRALLAVPATWTIVAVDGADPLPCAVGSDEYDEPTLYVASADPEGDPRNRDGCPQRGGAVGGMAYPLIGSRYEYLEGGEAVTVNGIPGTVHHIGGDVVIGKRLERLDVRRYSFPALDVGLVVRVDPDPTAIDRLLASLKLAPGFDRVADPGDAPQPLPEVPLPTRLVADALDVVDLDPATGEVRWRVGTGGEGWGGVSLAPDGTAWGGRVDHSCAFVRVVRFDADGLAVGEEVQGSRASSAPDGRRIAYTRGCVEETRWADELVVATSDLATLHVVRIEPPAAWAGRGPVGVDRIVWLPGGGRFLLSMSQWSGPTSRSGWFTLPVDATSTAEATTWATPGKVERALTVDHAAGTVLVAVTTGHRDDPDAETEVLEVDVDSGEVLATRATIPGVVRWLDADATGEHLVVVVDRAGNGERPSLRDALFRWHASTQHVYLGSGYDSADW